MSDTNISATQVKELREATGAGMMDAKKALVEASGDAVRATEILREKGLASAAKRAARSANQGTIGSYVHFNGTVGVLVEVNCETDFVANTPEFQQLAKDLALHIASPAAPRWLTSEEAPHDVLDAERRIWEIQLREEGKPEDKIPMIVEGKQRKFLEEHVLLEQNYVKDDSKTVAQLVDEIAAKVGEKVAVRRSVRYKLGEELD